MATPRILIVRSDQTTSPDWDIVLPASHWNVWIEGKLSKVVQRLSEIAPDLLVIEIEQAWTSDLNQIRKIRREAVIPILLLTSLQDADHLLRAYEVGVDDCILTPADPTLLRAKLKAWLRHSRSIPVGLLEPLFIGKINLAPADRTIVIESSEPIQLTNLEFRLLYYLLSRRNHIMTTDELCQRVWLDRDGGDTAALKNVVYRLRKKIEADPHTPQYLRTVTGVGYEFIVRHS